MVQYPKDQLDGLRRISSDLLLGEEQGITFIILKGLLLPEGCVPRRVDVLLCPSPWNGYPSRLLFAEKVSSPDYDQLNWNANGDRVLERNWYGFSWKVNGENLKLVQMVSGHLSAKKI